MVKKINISLQDWVLNEVEQSTPSKRSRSEWITELLVLGMRIKKQEQMQKVKNTPESQEDMMRVKFIPVRALLKELHEERNNYIDSSFYNFMKITSTPDFPIS